MGKGREQRERLSSAISQLATAHQELQFLRHKIERQQHLLHALWLLLKQRLDCTDEELLALTKEVEAGAATKEAPTCGQCGRALQEHSTICIYCGAENERRELF